MTDGNAGCNIFLPGFSGTSSTGYVFPPPIQGALNPDLKLPSAGEGPSLIFSGADQMLPLPLNPVVNHTDNNRHVYVGNGIHRTDCRPRQSEPHPFRFGISPIPREQNPWVSQFRGPASLLPPNQFANALPARMKRPFSLQARMPNTAYVPWRSSGTDQWNGHGEPMGNCEPRAMKIQKRMAEKQEDITNKSSNKLSRCDPCERDFNSSADLLAHQRTHVECEVSGCKFVASRKLMNLHFIQTHAEGKFRIRLLTDEDVKKWREERRRNYPTVANVKKKQELEALKADSGAVLKTTQFRYKEDCSVQKHGRGRGRGRKFQRKYQEYKRQHNIHSQVENINEVSLESDPAGIPNGCNGSINGDIVSNKIKDEIDCGQERKQLPSNDEHAQSSVNHITNDKNPEYSSSQMSTTPVLSETGNALQLLGAAYAGDDSDQSDVNNDSDVPSKEVNSRTVEEKDEAKKRNQCDMKKKTILQIDANMVLNNQSKKANSSRTTKPTLLEMLLANDIRRERNIILQCVDYIVKSNFFDNER